MRTWGTSTFALRLYIIGTSLKEGIPSDHELNELARKIGTNWNNLRLQIGILKDVHNKIETNVKR